MSMTDQERAAMLARGFTWAAENKSIEWLFDDQVKKPFWTKEFFENFARRNIVYDVRLVSETITATVTIPKPLKEWPKDGSNVWLDRGSYCAVLVAVGYQAQLYEKELNMGCVFATKNDANQSMEAMRKFRTGELL